MASKFSLHVIAPSATTDALIQSAPWRAVKAVNQTHSLSVAAVAGVGIRILRDAGTDALSPDAAAARLLTHDLADVTHVQLCCEDAKSYDPAWQLAVIDGLRAAGYVGRFLVGAFATGNPPTITGDPPHFPQLEPLYPLLRRPDVALAVDAYTGLLIFDPRWAAWAPYTVFRPTLIHDDLARQGIACDIVVTESGGDDVAPVTTGGGWQTRDWSSAEYLATLRAVDTDDRSHPWLLARCIFTTGATEDWQSYEILSILPQLAAYVQSQKEQAVDDLYELQWRSRKADVALNPDAAIWKDWIARRRSGDFSRGVPVTDEFPHATGVAMVFTNAIATWDAANGVQWH